MQPGSPTPAQRKFTEADIVAVLKAGEQGSEIADLCAAEGISEETYYDWVTKYSGLSAAEIKRRQRTQQKRSRTPVLAGALVVVLLGAGYVYIGNPTADTPVTEQPKSQPRPQPTPGAATSTVQAGFVPAPAATPVPAPTPAPAPAANSAETGQGPKAAVADGPELPKPGATEAAHSNGYVVQLAALPEQAEATALIEQLTGRGYRAFVTKTVAGQTELYRVRVGPFESRSAAEDTARHLERDGHRAPWVTR